jgi:hypothetical protein
VNDAIPGADLFLKAPPRIRVESGLFCDYFSDRTIGFEFQSPRLVSLLRNDQNAAIGIWSSHPKHDELIAPNNVEGAVVKISAPLMLTTMSPISTRYSGGSKRFAVSKIPAL